MDIVRLKRISRHIKALPSFMRNVSWAWLPTALKNGKENPFSNKVLILSLPRSGSSWVGETLGKADLVSYLREPITQSLLYNRGDFHTGSQHITTAFKIKDGLQSKLFDFCLNGIPRFRPGIVNNPSQWKFDLRSTNTLVIKEVNPLAFESYLGNDLKIIYLVRHPAAVASSFINLGWFDGNDCYNFGRRQAEIINETLGYLKKSSSILVVKYEDIAKNPISKFEIICEFAGIPFEGYVKSHIVKTTNKSISNDPFNTSRDSKSMINIWQDRLTKKQVDDILRGFTSLNKDFYS